MAALGPTPKPAIRASASDEKAICFASLERCYGYGQSRFKMNKVFSFGAYRLSCTAVVKRGGKFAPAVIAARSDWPSRPRELAIERTTHDTAEEAIETAYRLGMKWVNDHG